MIGGFEYYVREGYPVEGEQAERHLKDQSGLVCSRVNSKWSGAACRASAPAPPRRLWRRPSEHGDARGRAGARASAGGSRMRCGTSEALVAARRRCARSSRASHEWSLGDRGRWVIGRGSHGTSAPGDDAVSRSTPRSRSGRGCAWSAISTRATGRGSTGGDPPRAVPPRRRAAPRRDRDLGSASSATETDGARRRTPTCRAFRPAASMASVSRTRCGDVDRPRQAGQGRGARRHDLARQRQRPACGRRP